MPSRAEASRINGSKSHGPKTEEGRRAVSLNAVKHGLTAETVVLPTESEEQARGGSSGGSPPLKPVCHHEYQRLPKSLVQLQATRRAAQAKFQNEPKPDIPASPRSIAGTWPPALAGRVDSPLFVLDQNRDGRLTPDELLPGALLTINRQ